MKPIPRTIENTRVQDETLLKPGDRETAQDDHTDEFSANYCHSVTPKVLITSSDRPSLRTHLFMRELQNCIPNSDIKLRCGVNIKKILPLAARKGYSAAMIVNEDRKLPNALLIVHLPEGPSMYFKLSSFKRSYDIKVSFPTAIQ